MYYIDLKVTNKNINVHLKSRLIIYINNKVMNRSNNLQLKILFLIEVILLLINQFVVPKLVDIHSVFQNNNNNFIRVMAIVAVWYEGKKWQSAMHLLYNPAKKFFFVFRIFQKGKNSSWNIGSVRALRSVTYNVK